MMALNIDIYKNLTFSVYFNLIEAAPKSTQKYQKYPKSTNMRTMGEMWDGTVEPLQCHHFYLFFKQLLVLN